MRFPDTVTILRPTQADEYGNPGASWDAPATFAAFGFLVGSDLLMPPSADIRPGDRVRHAGKTYAVQGDPLMLRSPSKAVMWSVKLDRVPEV